MVKEGKKENSTWRRMLRYTSKQFRFFIFFFVFAGFVKMRGERKRKKINWNSKDSIPKSYIWSYKCNNLPLLYITESQELKSRIKMRRWRCEIVQKKQLFFIPSTNLLIKNIKKALFSLWVVKCAYEMFFGWKVNAKGGECFPKLSDG